MYEEHPISIKNNPICPLRHLIYISHAPIYSHIHLIYIEHPIISLYTSNTYTYTFNLHKKTP